MTDERRISCMEPLTIDEREVAAFRARDTLWAVIGDLFDRYHEEQDLTFAALGRRIGRSRAQVQKWLSSPANMTMQSAGLLAEGLDADLCVTLSPRTIPTYGANFVHPCEAAAALVRITFDENLQAKPTMRGIAVAQATSPTTIAARADYTLHFEDAQ